MSPQDLKAIRRELGLTLHEFGRALGYKGNRNTVTVQMRRYESGARDVPPWIGRLAWYMSRHGVPPEWTLE